jgi:hypothetical protein
MPEPRATRPHMPQYQLERSDEGLLPWTWGRERLAASRNYWVSTVSADGTPHSSAVWAVLIDDVLYFNCGPRSLKARNIAREPRVTVTTERADEAVIIEGRAALLSDASLIKRFCADYNAKYNWNMEPGFGATYGVAPDVGFGFIEHESQFGKTATRWNFGR